MTTKLLVTSVFAYVLKKTTENAKKLILFIQIFRNFPDVSERIRTHPDASKRIRMHPSASEQVRASPKTLKNLRKHRKTSEILAKMFAIACFNLEFAVPTACLTVTPWACNQLRF